MTDFNLSITSSTVKMTVSNRPLTGSTSISAIYKLIEDVYATKTVYGYLERIIVGDHGDIVFLVDYESITDLMQCQTDEQTFKKALCTQWADEENALINAFDIA